MDRFLNRRIKYDFPFLNIFKVPREVLKGACEAIRGFLRWLMNNKIMFDRYYSVNLTKPLQNEENIGSLYFITTSQERPTRRYI